jgi:hypothetical protein
MILTWQNCRSPKNRISGRIDGNFNELLQSVMKRVQVTRFELLEPSLEQIFIEQVKRGGAVMKNILIIARWEYLTRLRSKWFIISTLIMPLIILGSMFIPTAIMTSGDTESRLIAIVDENRSVCHTLRTKTDGKIYSER